MFLRGLIFYSWLCFFIVSSTARAQQPENSVTDVSVTGDFVWLENSALKVGLKKSSGGAIAWIGPAKTERNLINSFDRGRLVQQSWYGDEDGSFWDKQPWRWNPVQGGDWQGKPASIIEQRHDSTGSFVKTRPVHWANGDDLAECVMEQTVTLEDTLVHVRYRFLYSGKKTHAARHQELPAFFVDASLNTLVLYEGDAPWTDGPLSMTQPGFPNEYKKCPEHWAAYVGKDDHGIGCCVPAADELTCYRFGDNPKSPASCSYFAPIRTLAITPNFTWEYDVWITTGTPEEIRTRFQKIALNKAGSGI